MPSRTAPEPDDDGFERFGDQPDSELRILPLLSDEGNRRVLVDWLADRYEVVESEDVDATLRGGDVDLCVLDPARFDRHREVLIEYKRDQAPYHAPILLIRDEGTPLNDSDALRYIDDVVVMPVEKRTLAWRIASMLNLRTLSIRLERNRRQLEELAQAAAHDLRNPLNIAQGNVEMLEDGETLERVETSLDRMEHLIDDLLAVVRSTEAIAADDYEWVELSSLVAEGKQLTDIVQSNLELEGLENYAIRVKPIFVEQLLDNLLRNAVEHGGQDVTVKIGPLESGDGFYVEDDGPGIPDAQREAVFESGYSTASGSGIGLQVVQRVSEAHSWDISLTESRQGGARFEFSGVESR